MVKKTILGILVLVALVGAGASLHFGLEPKEETNLTLVTKALASVTSPAQARRIADEIVRDVPDPFQQEAALARELASVVGPFWAWSPVTPGKDLQPFYRVTLSGDGSATVRVAPNKLSSYWVGWPTQ